MPRISEQRRIVAYLDGLNPGGLLRDRPAKVNALRELQSLEGDASQSASGEELLALMPSILDRAFKGEL